MLRLRIAPEPHWIDLVDNVRVQVRPFTTGLMTAAEALVRAGPPQPDGQARYARLVAAIAEVAILDWEGVGDAEGQPAPVNAETISALMDVYLAAVRFEAAYVTPGLLIGSEKKSFVSSPNGGSAAVPATAAPATASAPNARGTRTRQNPSKAG